MNTSKRSQNTGSKLKSNFKWSKIDLVTWNNTLAKLNTSLLV